MSSERNVSGGLSIARVEALTDGIYAIAMTLLVLNLMIPEVPKDQAANKSGEASAAAC